MTATRPAAAAKAQGTKRAGRGRRLGGAREARRAPPHTPAHPPTPQADALEYYPDVTVRSASAEWGVPAVLRARSFVAIAGSVRPTLTRRNVLARDKVCQ